MIIRDKLFTSAIKRKKEKDQLDFTCRRDLEISESIDRIPSGKIDSSLSLFAVNNCKKKTYIQQD